MKFFKYYCFFILFFLAFQMNVFASGETRTRTEENLLVPKNVTVTEENKNSIMNTPSVDSSEKVYDFADLYTEQEKKKIYKKIADYIDHSDFDACVVTTKNLNGFSLSEYAENFYRYNEFRDTGVILVIYISTAEPQVQMDCFGNKVSAIYTDSRTRQTLQYIYQDIKLGNYYSSTTDYINILNGFYNIDHTKGNYRVGSNGEVVKEIPWLEVSILSAAVTFIVVSLFVFQLQRHSKVTYIDNLGYKVDNNSMVVQLENDQLIDRSLSKEK